jgi:hypothetical protein
MFITKIEKSTLKFTWKQSFISVQLEWLSSRAQITTNVGKGVAKQEPLYTVGGNVNVNYYNHYGKQ